MRRHFTITLVLVLGVFDVKAGPPLELRVGRAFHAFDHLGNIGEQAEAAAATGVNIIYATGLGGVGYSGLPDEMELSRQRNAIIAYNQSVRRNGIKLIIGYVCATSIVKLQTFDAGWSPNFRRQFSTPPSEWRQQGRDGKALPSWYGGDYQPACMNNPDWLAYEKFIVHEQLKTGHDGIFFDNPTVHPKGCYCRSCMDKFAVFLREAGVKTSDSSTEDLRRLADRYPKEFLRFRCTIARDFLAEIRRYARTINSRALITCNNSLNSPEVLYSQARTHGYNIFEKSKAEDFVVVEDQSHQPRLLVGNRTFEYGPTYRQLTAISHGKPIVAVTIAQGDYHTPPGLVRLAMAEAAAHGASYLEWPTWPAEQRDRMAKAIRPQAEFLREHENLLNNGYPRADVLLFLPIQQRWTETSHCVASELAATLTQRNVQYRVITEDDFSKSLRTSPVIVVENLEVLDPAQRKAITNFERRSGRVISANQTNWWETLKPSIELKNAQNVRAVIYDQPRRTIVHLYNLGIERISSFEDRVHPVTNLALRVRVPFEKLHSVTALTADVNANPEKLPFTIERSATETAVHARIPKLEINTILVLAR